MKIVGIRGSPRKAGNTEFLLSEALAIATEYGIQTQSLPSSRQFSIGPFSCAVRTLSLRI